MTPTPTLLAVLAVAALAAPAPAVAYGGGSTHYEPGSLLLYPTFDNRGGVATVLTITNTSLLAGAGAVEVRFDYVARYGPLGQDLGCSNFARTATLTPGDTLSVLTQNHNPNQAQGYVYAYARSEDGRPTVWNFLAGSLLQVDGIQIFETGMPALSFSGIGDGVYTDLDADGVRDLDGLEYGLAPGDLAFPRFVGQGPQFGDRLLLIDLSGGAGFTTVVDLLVYNDNEEVFSTQRAFSCWDAVRLSEISSVFDNDFLRFATNHDPSEQVAPGRETGWFRLDGNIATSETAVILDPAVHAVHVEQVDTTPAAQMPFFTTFQGNAGLRPLNALAGS